MRFPLTSDVTVVDTDWGTEHLGVVLGLYLATILTKVH